MRQLVYCIQWAVRLSLTFHMTWVVLKRISSALKSQEAVTGYKGKKQIVPFGFAQKCYVVELYRPMIYLIFSTTENNNSQTYFMVVSEGMLVVPK